MNTKEVVSIYGQFEKYITEYYDNDPMGYYYASNYYYNHTNELAGITCRFTNDTVILFSYPRTELEENKITVKVIVKGKQASFKIDDLLSVLDNEGNIPVSFLEDLDLQIIRTIHNLKKIK